MTFHQHITHEHNVWHYLSFVVHLKTKDTTEFTGPESYVFERIEPSFQVSLSLPLSQSSPLLSLSLSLSLSLCLMLTHNTHIHVCTTIPLSLQNKPADLEWFPRLRCMSLNTEEVEQEQNEMKELQRQLKETTSLVKNLSSQLNDLREKVAN